MANETSIGALWRKVAKSGVEYLSGKVKVGETEIEIVVFSNDKGGNDSRPDYRIFVSQPREGRERNEAEAPRKPVAKPAADGYTDDIPW
jgi:uncharacterized protein (DUF736 family)